MPRSVLTLAAAAAAALPGAEIVRAQSLTSGGDGRCDSIVATTSDGTAFTLRVPTSEHVERELAAEAIALRALSSGVREILSFEAPTVLGTTRFDETTAYAAGYIPGYLVAAADIPRGRGAATSIGAALAELHSLPLSVVRSAGLPVRSPDQSRSEVQRVIEAAGASRRVPVRLMVRWREAIEDTRLWAFESTVSLGGAQSTSFVLNDDARVVGVLDWHGLSVDDPALDLGWVASAPDAADDIFTAYTERSHRAPDAALRVRARLHAELEFARWLVHGAQTHDDQIVEDAAALLESLSESVRDDRLLAPLGEQTSDVDDALDAIGRVPEAAPNQVDTSMHTDAYDPSELSLLAEDEPEQAAPEQADPESLETQPDISLPHEKLVDPGATVPLDMDEFIAHERE
ncbi:MAG: phosphotransferase [Microbacterium sp.]